MGNIIIAIILAGIFILAIKGSIKHFRGEGGCCGGGSTPKPKEKKLKGKVIKTSLWQIDGMHCQNCANFVTRAVNDIEGASAKVNLRKKEVQIRCDRNVDSEIIIQAIEQKGYTVRKMNVN